MRGLYYSKRRGLNDAINELIVSKLAPLANILSPEIKIIKREEDEGYYRVLSSNLELLGHFNLASNFLDTKNYKSGYISLYDIWDKIETEYPLNPELMEQVVKMYLFDFFMIYSDRHASNWGILEKDGIKMVAIIDNEDSFDNSSYSMITSTFDAKGYFDSLYSGKRLNNFEKNKNELENFFSESSEEVLKIFEDLLNHLTKDNFKKVLDEVEKKEYILVDNVKKEKIKIPYKQSLISIYNERYDLLKEFYENIKDRRNGRR